jgi:hypothetical protein
VQLEKEERPSSSLPITITNVAVDPDQFDVEEEDLGLGPMDEDIERDRDRLAARTFEQQLQVGFLIFSRKLESTDWSIFISTDQKYF